jgi:hypothetical protein
VFFHNGKGCDNHFILQAISQVDDIENCMLNVISDNSEKYKMVNFRGYKFLDSLSFLNAGLSKLANNLIGGNPESVPRFHEAFNQKGLTKDELIRVTRKGVFPYKWFPSVEKLGNSDLPCREEFFNDLSGEKCSEEDYAQAVLDYWERFKCKTFREYHDMYLEADVVEAIREIEIEIEIVYNMCRQTGPTALSRATLLRHSGLISKLGPVFSTRYTYRHT